MATLLHWICKLCGGFSLQDALAHCSCSELGLLVPKDLGPNRNLHVLACVCAVGQPCHPEATSWFQQGPQVHPQRIRPISPFPPAVDEQYLCFMWAGQNSLGTGTLAGLCAAPHRLSLTTAVASLPGIRMLFLLGATVGPKARFLLICF